MGLVTRLSLIISALVFLTAVAIGLANYFTFLSVIEPRELSRLEGDVRLHESRLQSVALAARQDVLAINQATAVVDAARAGSTGDPSIVAELRANLEAYFAAELATNPNYLQFRLIGVADGGRELVRVDRSGAQSGVRARPPAELQPKGDRAYFQNTLELAAGEIYVSPIELNRERRQIEEPHTPVMRIATPVVDADAKALGILIANVDMGAVLSAMRAAIPPDRELHVVNADGDYLSAPDPSLDFAFEFGAAPRLQDAFPDIGSRLDREMARSAIFEHSSGERFGAAILTTRLGGGPWLTIVETVSYDTLLAPASAAGRSSALGAVLAAAAAAVAAGLLARSLASPLAQITRAVADFRGGGVKSLPTEARGEIGRLARAVRQMSGEVSAKTASLTREIEERKRVAAELDAMVRRERRYRAAIDSSDDAIVILDLDGTVLSWNAGATLLYGWTAEEAIGRGAEALSPAEHADETPAALETIRVGGRVEQFETVRQTKDGRRVDVSISLSPIVSAGGEIVGACKIARDISARKLEEERFRLAIEASPNGMVITDASGRIRLVNSTLSRLFGFERSELLGQPMEMLLPERLRAEHAEQRARFARKPEMRSMGEGRDLYGRRKNGEEFPVEVGLNPLETREGPMVLGVVIDITARKEAEEKIERYTADLRRSNAELEEFAYVAAHDLQEPLRMVASYSELLAQRYAGQLDERADKYILYAVDGAKRMKRLIDDLLAYSRIGTQGRRFEPVDSAAVVEAALQDYRAQIEATGAEITVGALPVVTADPVQLGQVFANLIGNALKFRSDAAPRVTVNATRVRQEWAFAVSDNGVGIEPEYSERIFQMFQRLHERGRYEGSGIGLSITRKIVTRHGGRIWFKSTPGQGATFHFTIPIRGGDHDGEADPRPAG